MVGTRGPSSIVGVNVGLYVGRNDKSLVGDKVGPTDEPGGLVGTKVGV